MFPTRVALSGLALAAALVALPLCGARVAAQALHLPPTGVDSGLQVGIGYGLLDVGTQGPYIVGDFRVGRPPAPPNPPVLMPPPNPLPKLGPQDALLLIRDTKGVPAFKALAAAKTPIPTLTIRTYNRTFTFADVAVTQVMDAYGSATSPVPIENALLHFDSVKIVNLTPASPGAMSSPTSY